MAPSQEERIPITSATELAYHFQTIQDALAEKETEDSWQRLDRALARLEAVTKGGGYKFDDFVGYMKSIAMPLSSALLSERTRLSGTAGDVLTSVAPRLADRFEPLVQLYVPPLLQICARTNKVALKRAEKCLQLISRHCRLPNLLPLFKEAMKDKYAGLRAVAVACVVTLYEAGATYVLYKKATEVEAMIAAMAKDPNPEVRQNCKRLFQVYIDVWPERVESYTAAFSPTIRRFLALPKTGGLKVEVPSVRPLAAALQPVSTREQSAPNTESRTIGRSRNREGENPRPVSEDSPKREKFLEALVAAKNKKKAMPSTMPSTGALRSFSTASLFGGAPAPPRVELDKSRSRQEKDSHRERQRTERRRSADSGRETEINPFFRQGTLTRPTYSAAELGSSCTATPEVLSVNSSLTRVQRTDSKLQDGRHNKNATFDDYTPGESVSMQKSSFSNDALDGPSTQDNYLSQRESQAASAAQKILAQDGGGTELVESECHGSAPSDRVALRLANMEEQTRGKGRIGSAEVQASAGEIDASYTPQSATACALPSKTPKALRVVMLSQPAVHTLQRQPSAVRVAAPSLAASALLTREGTTPQKFTTPTGASFGHGSTVMSTATTAPPETALVKKRTPAVTGKTIADKPFKASGKVASSTAQGMRAKNRALGGVSTASQKATAPQSGSSNSMASKAATAQAAREAIVAKKQAEVARMKAANRARAEAAASRDSAYQISKRINVQRQKLAAGTGANLPPHQHAPAIEQTEAERLAAADWDAHKHQQATERHSEPAKATVAASYNKSKEETVDKNSSEDPRRPATVESPVRSESREKVRNAEELLEKVTMQPVPTTTPARKILASSHETIAPSLVRTPLGSLTPNAKNVFTQGKSASSPGRSPGKTPVRFTPLRQAMTSPADKLLRRDQVLQQQQHPSHDVENIFIETAPLRLSPLKSRPATPRSVLKSTQPRAGQVISGATSDDERQSDEEELGGQQNRRFSPLRRGMSTASSQQTPVKSAVPRHLLTPFRSRSRQESSRSEEYDSSASSFGEMLTLSGKKEASHRMQLICGRQEVDTDVDTDVDEFITF